MRKSIMFAFVLAIFCFTQNTLLAQPQEKGKYLDTTCEFGGRVGNVIFRNNSAYPINVKLWHPDSQNIYTSTKVSGHASRDFKINVGDDWGVQLGSSKIKCIGAIADWTNDTFIVNSSTFY